MLHARPTLMPCYSLKSYEGSMVSIFNSFRTVGSSVVAKGEGSSALQARQFAVARSEARTKLKEQLGIDSLGDSHTYRLTDHGARDTAIASGESTFSAQAVSVPKHEVSMGLHTFTEVLV